MTRYAGYKTEPNLVDSYLNIARDAETKGQYALLGIMTLWIAIPALAAIPIAIICIVTVGIVSVIGYPLGKISSYIVKNWVDADEG